MTQVGSGQFHNQTRGVAALELVNPSVRSMGFSPDGSFVTFWVRRQNDSTGGPISIWRVATLGGQPRPHLEGIAEADWSADAARLVYHTRGVTAEEAADPLPSLVLRRGARHLAFVAGRRALVLLRGESQHIPTSRFATSTSLRTAVKLSLNACRSTRMSCCWSCPGRDVVDRAPDRQAFMRLTVGRRPTSA